MKCQNSHQALESTQTSKVIIRKGLEKYFGQRLGQAATSAFSDMAWISLVQLLEAHAGRASQKESLRCLDAPRSNSWCSSVLLQVNYNGPRAKTRTMHDPFSSTLHSKEHVQCMLSWSVPLFVAITDPRLGSSVDSQQDKGDGWKHHKYLIIWYLPMFVLLVGPGRSSLKTSMFQCIQSLARISMINQASSPPSPEVICNTREPAMLSNSASS